MGTMLHIHHRGAAGAPPVVLLHGFMGRGAAWADWSARLATTHQVLMPDLPGHGASVGLEDQAYTMPGAAAALLEGLDAAAVARADVVGYSMGGRLALYLAVCHPARVRSLTLVSASPGLRTAKARAKRRRQDAARAEALQADFAGFVARWYGQPVFDGLSPQLRAARVALRQDNDPAELARSLQGMGTGAQPPLWERLDALAVSTAALAGGRDAKYVAMAQAMAAARPAITAHVCAGAGHVVQDEHAGALHRVLALQLSPVPICL